MKRSTSLASSMVLLLVLLVPQEGDPCAPLFPEAVFTFQRHPDAPLKLYAQGNLGVVLPSFARSYLVVAYRHLSGRPLAATETRGALNGWLRKLRGAWLEPSKVPIEEWSKARAAIFGPNDEPPSLSAFRKELEGYAASNTTCQPDSFHTAVLTLKDRARRFGVKSAELREWTRGQDVVFSNCTRGENIPTMVSARSPVLLQADRRYQIAAAHFYAGDYGTAVSEFDQIGHDKGSPWHTIAPYLAARASIRSGAAFPEAEARLLPVLRDKSRNSIHPAVHKLLGYIAYQRDPEKRTHELARVLAGSHADPNFEQDMIDYTFGLDRTLGGSPDFWNQADATREKVQAEEAKWAQQRYLELSKFALSEDMTDWIFTFQQSGETGGTHAIQRWRRQHTLPWLVAAISKIDADDKVAQELVQAAEQVPLNSPAYTTIAYHRVRLLLQTGEEKNARILLGQLLSELDKKISASPLNLFLAQRMKVATSFEDFLAYASRSSVGEDSRGEDVGDDWLGCGWNQTACTELVYGRPSKKEAPLERRFDPESALIFNTLIPLELLAQAEASPELPENLRKELAVSTWTRAAMLGRHDVSARLAADAAKAYPVMKSNLESYSRAGSPQDKWRAALFAILHFPGARPYVNARSGRSTPLQRIDNYRDNWWCKDIGSYPDAVNYLKDNDSHSRFSDRRDAHGYPAFLSAKQLNTAKSEWKTLSASGSAADYLPQQTLKWAKEAPGDPRILEALHYAVRATRYGCDGNKADKLSQEAFKLLHSRYPNSKWAKDTPYWY